MGKTISLEELKTHSSVVRESSTPFTIEGLTTNSKLVKKNFLFIAERGVSSDGHQYIPMAIANGATALLVEDPSLVPSDYLGLVLKTDHTRALAPILAASFYNNPSEKLFCVGVTGTNGKTSFTYLIEHLFNSINRPTGVIGTINHHLARRVWPTEMTTPHPIELQQRLADFVDHGAKTLAIEVSSHALDQKRIEGIEFDVGVFTNLTRDHLDYHSTMDEYFAVKQRFFTEILQQSTKKDVVAIINRDDPWGVQMSSGSHARVWSYGAAGTDFSYQLETMNFSGTQFKLFTPSGNISIKSPLIGVHNIYNVMAAIGAALAGGLSLSQIESAITTFAGIPGRLQLVPNSKQISVLVDYAHSPDALENVLKSLQKVRQDFNSKGKIICVFGCGGDRDKGKRPLMARVAECLSDLVIVTSDNPRTEDPLQIINDIQKGFSPAISSTPLIEPDRAKAIELALSHAKTNDVILIAGKGHEDYQIIGKEKFYFSDYETARKLLI
jgi:UDP-N-acetylmuramoyl-L-alanyl-D-glutamate--2,6-diaminopimelate ligase